MNFFPWRVQNFFPWHAETDRAWARPRGELIEERLSRLYQFGKLCLMATIPSDTIRVGDRVSWVQSGRRCFGYVDRVSAGHRFYTVIGEAVRLPLTIAARDITRECA